MKRNHRDSGKRCLSPAPEPAAALPRVGENLTTVVHALVNIQVRLLQCILHRAVLEDYSNAIIRTQCCGQNVNCSGSWRSQHSSLVPFLLTSNLFSGPIQYRVFKALYCLGQHTLKTPNSHINVLKHWSNSEALLWVIPPSEARQVAMCKDLLCHGNKTWELPPQGDSIVSLYHSRSPLGEEVFLLCLAIPLYPLLALLLIFVFIY